MGVAEIIGAVLLAGCLLVVFRAWWRFRLIRRGGVDVWLRTAAGGRVGPWRQGVARYQGDQLAWYWVASLRRGPDVILDRTELELTDRRMPSTAESYSLPPSAVILACRLPDVRRDVAMARDVLTGFLSWLEAEPPGRGTGYRQAC